LPFFIAFNKQQNGSPFQEAILPFPVTNGKTMAIIY
jgi:hypothetical protein